MSVQVKARVREGEFGVASVVVIIGETAVVVGVAAENSGTEDTELALEEGTSVFPRGLLAL